MGRGVTGDTLAAHTHSGSPMSAVNSPKTGQIAVPIDPARRPDVLLRRRAPEGHRVNAWWLIGAFAAVSLTVIGLMNFFPGG